MQHTPNCNLKKPGLNDYVNIEDLNENADVIDQELKVNEVALTTHLAEGASLTKKGHVQLNDTVTSTSKTQAATANAVKTAYDRAVDVDSEQVNVRNSRPPNDLSSAYPTGYTYVPMTQNDTNIDLWLNEINGTLGTDYNSAQVRLKVSTERWTSAGGAVQTVVVVSNFTASSGEILHVLKRGASSFSGNSTWSPLKRIMTQNDYDELFQFANDGKTAVANALTTKGVTASPADTFTLLATKIGQINTGKKFASGTTTVSANNISFTMADGSARTSSAVTVSGLDFDPSLILLVITGGSGNIYPATIYQKKASFSNSHPSVNISLFRDSSPPSYYRETGGAYVSYGSFRIPANPFSVGETASWYAYE